MLSRDESMNIHAEEENLDVPDAALTIKVVVVNFTGDEDSPDQNEYGEPTGTSAAMENVEDLFVNAASPNGPRIGIGNEFADEGELDDPEAKAESPTLLGIVSWANPEDETFSGT